MKKLLVALAAITVVVAMSGVAYGSNDDDRNGGSEFKAELSGRQEVPRVRTRTSGEAKFSVEDGAIEFELEIEDAVGILGAAGAHIHCAPAGQNGPVVAFLAGVVPGGLDGDVELKATLSERNIVDPACGATIDELVASMADGDTYVNVHSIRNPGGEVRGQIGRD